MKHIFLAIMVLFTAGHSNGQSQEVLIYDLQKCIDVAIENNLSVKRSALNLQSSKVNLDQARASQLPSLNLGGNYGFNWGRSIDPTTNQFINRQINSSGINGQSSVVLFNWFRLTNTVKQNKLALDASISDVNKAKNDISLNIVTFYLNVIFNRELLENAEYQLESSNNQLERTKKLVAGGALPRTNELELTSQVATNEVNLINAQNNLQLALLSLKQAMLMPNSQELELVIPEMEVADDLGDTETADVVYESALENMPEIKSAEFRLASAAMAVKVAESGYTPTISLNAGFNTNYSSAINSRFITDSNLPPVQYNTGLITESGDAVFGFQEQGMLVDYGFSEQWDANLSRFAAINLSIPIFNNLRAKSNVQRSKITLQQAEITILEQKNLLRQTIEQAYYDAQAASKTYMASTRQVEALTETFRSIENQYQLGASNFTDYQVAENNLFRAKSDLVRAKYDYLFKVKILDFYQGKTINF